MAQFLVERVVEADMVEVDELPESKRSGGFGSTGSAVACDWSFPMVLPVVQSQGDEDAEGDERKKKEEIL